RQPEQPDPADLIAPERRERGDRLVDRKQHEGGAECHEQRVARASPKSQEKRARGQEAHGDDPGDEQVHHSASQTKPQSSTPIAARLAIWRSGMRSSEVGKITRSQNTTRLLRA